MTRTSMILTVTLLLLTSPAYAATETASIHVNGMVCDFCARALEKVFGREDSVDHITVSLSDKLITVEMKDGQSLPDAKIKSLINDAGYDVRDITRTVAGGVHE